MNDLVQIQNLIYEIRGLKVMLDSDLANLYGVETKSLNRAVKRNIERFPVNFMFQLTKEEWQNLRCQNGTFKNDIRKYLPYVFTEQGVAMLSSVLRSKQAIQTNIQNEKDKQQIYEVIDLFFTNWGNWNLKLKIIFTPGSHKACKSWIH